MRSCIATYVHVQRAQIKRCQAYARLAFCAAACNYTSCAPSCEVVANQWLAETLLSCLRHSLTLHRNPQLICEADVI